MTYFQNIATVEVRSEKEKAWRVARLFLFL
jgi:hypothetical protein